MNAIATIKSDFTPQPGIEVKAGQEWPGDLNKERTEFAIWLPKKDGILERVRIPVNSTLVEVSDL